MKGSPQSFEDPLQKFILIVGANPDEIPDIDAVALITMPPTLIPWAAAYPAPLAPNPYMAVPTVGAATAATVTAMHLDDITCGCSGGNS
jgi:hypothetical protein